MYQLNLSEEQARVISSALDLYSRIGIGQFEEILNVLKMYDKKVFSKDTSTADKLLQEVKREVYDLTPNSSFGIYNENVPNRFRVAWDIKKVIQHQFWQEGTKEFMNVDSYPPDSSSQLPLPTITKVE